MFELRDGHLATIEVTPGIDIDKDILAHMDVNPLMPSAPKSLLFKIFQPMWGELKAIITAKTTKPI